MLQSCTRLKSTLNMWLLLYVNYYRSFVDEYRAYTSQYLIHLCIVTVLSLATFIKFYYLVPCGKTKSNFTIS